MLPDKITDFDTAAVTVTFVDLDGYSVLTEICGDREADTFCAPRPDRHHPSARGQVGAPFHIIHAHERSI